MSIFDKLPRLPGAHEASMTEPLRPQPPEQPALSIIGKEEIKKATEILQKYKQGKAHLEKRVVEDEQWWELRHWEVLRRNKRRRLDENGKPLPGYADTPSPEPTSAWLFNAILNKHADAMDNMPEPVVLPRESSDQESARVLSEILPVVMEANGFDSVYSDNWWEKLKHGAAVYGVFWNPKKENGLGDIDIRSIDLLNIFWEPGISDIQDSANLFIVELVDEELLAVEYPEAGKVKGSILKKTEYVYNETIDTSEKALVVDWYYKQQREDGRLVLHYAKFAGDVLLYASENDPEMQGGWYDHGLYPVFLDSLFPSKGTPAGFGYVALCKDPQTYIDRLSGNILEASMMGTKKRYFASTSSSINREVLLDWNDPLIEIEGSIDDTRIREVTVNPIPEIYYNVLQGKIEEIKDTAANRDVNSGGVGSGVTAAAAIAALQEAGNKASRDMIAAAYRCYARVAETCVELMRQFYDETRTFRVMGAGSEPRFVDFSAQSIRTQPSGTSAAGEQLYRKPVFDLKIKAQKKNPFSRMEQNETAKELYRLGFFAPENAQASLIALEMMDFEGIEEVRAKVAQGQTLHNMLQQIMQMQLPPGGMPPVGAAPMAAAPTTAAPAAMTDYGRRLAAQSRPSL